MEPPFTNLIRESSSSDTEPPPRDIYDLLPRRHRLAGRILRYLPYAGTIYSGLAHYNNIKWMYDHAKMGKGIYQSATDFIKKHNPKKYSFILPKFLQRRRTSYSQKKKSMPYGRRFYRRSSRYRRRLYRRRLRRYGLSRRYSGRRRYFRRRITGPSQKYVRKLLTSRFDSKIRKRANNRRASLILPPIGNAKWIDTDDTIIDGNRWAVYSPAVWSYFENLHTIAYVADSREHDERASYQIHTFPWNLLFQFTQPRDKNFYYRILLIKCLSEATVASSVYSPTAVLRYPATSFTAVFSPYVDAQTEARPFPFKILYDKVINVSSYGADNADRNINIKVPSCNVIYDKTQANGNYSKNNIILAVVTTANAATGGYNWGVQGRMYFNDYINVTY